MKPWRGLHCALSEQKSGPRAETRCPPSSEINRKSSKICGKNTATPPTPAMMPSRRSGRSTFRRQHGLRDKIPRGAGSLLSPARSIGTLALRKYRLKDRQELFRRRHQRSKERMGPATARSIFPDEGACQSRCCLGPIPALPCEMKLRRATYLACCGPASLVVGPRRAMRGTTGLVPLRLPLIFREGSSILPFSRFCVEPEPQAARRSASVRTFPTSVWSRSFSKAASNHANQTRPPRARRDSERCITPDARLRSVEGVTVASTAATMQCQASGIPEACSPVMTRHSNDVFVERRSHRRLSRADRMRSAVLPFKRPKRLLLRLGRDARMICDF